MAASDAWNAGRETAPWISQPPKPAHVGPPQLSSMATW
jgi:hypothetical protein